MAEGAVQALARAFGGQHPSVLGAQMHVAMALHAIGRVSEAVAMLREVHSAQLRVHHGEATHPDVLETAWRLGRALIALHPTLATPAPSPQPVLAAATTSGTTPVDISPPSAPCPQCPPPARHSRIGTAKLGSARTRTKTDSCDKKPPRRKIH